MRRPRVALAEAPLLELGTVRFAIASAVLVVLALVTRTPLPIRRWRAVTAAAALGSSGSIAWPSSGSS